MKNLLYGGLVSFVVLLLTGNYVLAAIPVCIGSHYYHKERAA